MAFILEALVNNTSYDLSDKLQGFDHLANTGFAMPPVQRYSQSGPLQQGETDVGFRLNPRIISLILGIFASDELDYWQQRNRILNIFKPKFTNIPVKIRVTLPDGTVRQIDTHYLDDLSLSSNDKHRWFHKIAVKLKAPDPTWYNPVGSTVPFSISGNAGFTVPMSVPFDVGTSTLNVTQSVDYAGTWDAYPIITVYGPVDDLKIENLTTSDKLDFDTYSLSAGQILTIDTRYGNKTVRREDGSNQISNLTTDSDLATFRLVAAEDSSAYLTNDIRVTGSNINTTTRVIVQYNERFIGL